MIKQEEVVNAYRVLCTRVGDLYFAKATLESQLAGIQEELDKALKERNRLHLEHKAALEGVKSDVVAAAPSEGQ